MREPDKWISRNKLKLNGRVAKAMASSTLLKPRFVPPLPALASMKLKLRVATFALSAGAVTVKTGPVPARQKTETVMGPGVAPNGTRMVIEVDVALTIG